MPEPALSEPETPAAHPATESPPPTEVPALRVQDGPLAPRPSRIEELVARLRFVLPQHQDYQHAFGLELQWALWFRPSWGVALSGGIDRWAAEQREYFEDVEAVLRPQLDGSALALPFGGSLLYRSDDVGAKLRLTAELGLRFVYLISDVTMTYEFVDHYGQPTRVQDTVDLDPRVIALGRLELSGSIEPPWDWFLGAGYQKDFTEGENWLYEEVANDLSGIVISAGVRRRI